MTESSTPDLTHNATFAEALENALSLHTSTVNSGVHKIEETFKEQIEKIEKAVKVADKKAAKPLQRLANLLHSVNDHLDDIRDHHLGDEKDVKKADELIGSIKEALVKFKHDPEALLEGLESRLTFHNVKVVGHHVRDANIPMHQEYWGQVKDGFGGASILGKAVGVVGGSVSLGVVTHGMLNVKRGLFGYQDQETGEQKSGGLSVLIVGAGEIAAGLAGLKKALTGRWGFGRATHEREHHHDHDHGHHHH